MSESKPTWPEIVNNSNGKMFFLPEKFRKDAEEVEKLRASYNKDVSEMAKKEIRMKVATQRLFLDIREWLDKEGRGDEAWTKDLGFNTMALDEGQFVVDFVDRIGN